MGRMIISLDIEFVGPIAYKKFAELQGQVSSFLNTSRDIQDKVVAFNSGTG